MFRGWGFIIGDDRRDYFVHWSFIEGTGDKFLWKGERVEFEPIKTYQGLQATNVTILKEKKNRRIRLKPNPFTPQEPVTDPNKFAGRGEAIRNAVDALFNNKNIIVTGERGIGKSSVAYQLIYMAQGDMALIDKLEIDTDGFQFSFVTGDHRCVPGNTLSDIVSSLTTSLLTNLNIKEKEIKRTTEWLVDLKLFKVGQKKELAQIEVSEIVDQFVAFISDIIQKGKRDFNGITFLIDEIDCLPPDVQLAPFFKAAVEALRFKRYDNVSFITAGVTGTMTNLITQHPSFSRLFENLELRRMPEEELDEIIVKALIGTRVEVHPAVKSKIISLADRFPEPVQLLGYHTYRYDTNSLLEIDDLGEALSFIINELKRQEFSELYERAGKGIAEAIVRAMASFDKHEMSVAQVSSKIKINERTTALGMADLANMGVLTKVGHGIYKLRDPLFKIYLRWVLGSG
jgi:cold shock CspA family protein